MPFLAATAPSARWGHQGPVWGEARPTWVQAERPPSHRALLQVPAGHTQKTMQGQSAVGRRRRGAHGGSLTATAVKGRGGARPRGGDQPTEGMRLLKLSSRTGGPQGPLPAPCWWPPTPPPRPVQPRGGPQARVSAASEDTMRSVTRGAAPSTLKGRGLKRAQAPPTGQGTNALAFTPDCPAHSHLLPAPHHRRPPKESESF